MKSIADSNDVVKHMAIRDAEISIKVGQYIIESRLTEE